MKQGNTIGNHIYVTLRKNIIDLRLIPGSDISIKDIAEMLEVSRSPVRDALIRLEKEGLVDTIPQRGTFVSKIDLHRVDEERFFRASLEEKVVELCMHRWNQDDIAEMEKKIQKQQESLREKDYYKLLQYDDEFHEIFFRIADKILCWDMIQNMSGHYRRMRHMALFDNAIIGKNIENHKAMADSLKNKKEEELIGLTRKHLSNLANETEDIVRQFPSYFRGMEEKTAKEVNFLKRDFLNLMH